MPCHNQQVNNISSGQEHPMKQVRFANSTTTTSNNNVPGVLSNNDSNNVAVQSTNNQENLGPQLKLLPLNDQIRELQTIIRDKWVPLLANSYIELQSSLLHHLLTSLKAKCAVHCKHCFCMYSFSLIINILSVLYCIILHCNKHIPFKICICNLV